jgi:hypothetical protein
MAHRDYQLAVIDPENPNGPKIQAVIPYSVFSKYKKYYPVRYENLRAAKFVLENPKRLFSGIRQFNEGGWCFTGRPEMWYVREEVRATFPEHLVFCVYLNSNFNVYEARAETADPNDGFCPNDWQNRYGGLVWKSTS